MFTMWFVHSEIEGYGFSAEFGGTEERRESFVESMRVSAKKLGMVETTDAEVIAAMQRSVDLESELPEPETADRKG